MPDPTPAGLASALDDARARFLDALGAVDLDLVLVPGVVEDWSVRDLVVHVAAWAEHGTNAVELAETGRGDAFDYDTSRTDAMNVDILAEARRTSPSAALEREATAFDRFRAAVRSLDPGILPLRLGNGDTVAEVIRYDGPDHYAEHTAHLRAWFGSEAEDEAADDADDDAADA
jgi:hypothetical protein